MSPQIYRIYLNILKLKFEFIKDHCFVFNERFYVCMAEIDMKPWDVEDYVFYVIIPKR